MRLWQDNREILLPMACRETEPEPPDRTEIRERRYGVTFSVPDRGTLVWYYFVLRLGERTLYYGNNEARQGGMGRLWDREPPSYQITDAGLAETGGGVPDLPGPVLPGTGICRPVPGKAGGPDPQHLGRESLLCEG